MKEKQCTETVLMVRPANFGFNPETAENNAFQVNDTSKGIEEIKDLARVEFDRFVEVLKAHKIEVIVVEDTIAPVKTDSIFPNNWFSTHVDGKVFIYSMYSPNRRLEKRREIIDLLDARYVVKNKVDLSYHEENNKFLEGTGSMILDRPNKKVYACISERSHKVVLTQYAEDLDYELVAFTAVDNDDIKYYHTNVIMALGEVLAVICLESIVDSVERNHVEQLLEADGKIIIDITRSQVEQFAGNMLQVNGADGKKYLIMSTSAFNSLTPSQVLSINEYCEVIHSDLAIIEKYGGGSARCMLAEIFLSKKSVT